MGCLDKARYGIAWGAIGAAMDCYDSAKRYSLEREQFGKPIAKFQGIAFKLADMATKIEASELLLLQAADLKMRGEKALAFLLSRQGNHIAVITHGKFMRMLTSLMVYGDKLTSQAFEPFFHTFVTSNTGITLCLHDEKSWKIRSWNDHAHLGEIVDK